MSTDHQPAVDFISCDFIFEGRSMNFDSHNLAKLSSSLNVGRYLWMGSPHDPFVIPVNRTPNIE